MRRSSLMGVVLVASLVVGLAPTVAAAQPVTPPSTVAGCPSTVGPATFTDRAAIAEVHRASVDCLAGYAVATGRADGSFGPQVPVRRDQLASLLARTLARTDAPPLPEPRPARFVDVVAGSAHDEAVHRLAAAGIVDGVDATRFDPASTIRRDQLVALLLRAVEWATDTDLGDDGVPFDDVAADNVHREAIGGAVAQGLVRGFGDGTFRPAIATTRQQVASMLVGLLARTGTSRPAGPVTDVTLTPSPPIAGRPVTIEVGVVDADDRPVPDTTVVVDVDGDAVDEPRRETDTTDDDGRADVEVVPDGPGSITVEVTLPDLDGPATDVIVDAEVIADPRPHDPVAQPDPDGPAARTDVTFSVAGVDAALVRGTEAAPLTLTTTIEDPDGVLDDVTVGLDVLDASGTSVLLDTFDGLTLTPGGVLGVPTPAWGFADDGATVTLGGTVAADAPLGEHRLQLSVVDDQGRTLALDTSRTVTVTDAASPPPPSPDPEVRLTLADGEGGVVTAAPQQQVGLRLRVSGVAADRRVRPEVELRDATGAVVDVGAVTLTPFTPDGDGFASITGEQLPALLGDGGAAVTFGADLSTAPPGPLTLAVTLVAVDPTDGTTLATLGRDEVTLEVRRPPTPAAVRLDVPGATPVDQPVRVPATATATGGGPAAGATLTFTASGAAGPTPTSGTVVADGDGVAVVELAARAPGPLALTVCVAGTGTCADATVTVLPDARRAPTATVDVSAPTTTVAEGDELPLTVAARLTDPDRVVAADRSLQLVVRLRVDGTGPDRSADETVASAFDPTPGNLFATFTPAQRPQVTTTGIGGEVTVIFASRARGTYEVDVALVDPVSGQVLGRGARSLTVTAPPPALTGSVVIDEVATRGPNGASDELVELLNPTDRVIAIGGWQLRSCNDRGFVATRVTVPAGTVLQPGQRYLAASRTYTGPGMPDGERFQGAITDRGGVVLRDTALRKVDGIGFAVGAAACVEGRPATNVTVPQAVAGLTPQRTPSGTNTQDNAADLTVRARTPQGRTG